MSSSTKESLILAGKTALVTGGAVRIGQALCRSLAAAGVNVCLHYGKSSEEAQATVEELLEAGVHVSAVSADLRDPVAAAQTIFRHAVQEHSKVDYLINSAAIYEPGTLLSTDEAQWERHLAINLKAPFFLTQEFARQLPESHFGAVVNIIDWRAEFPVSGHIAYTIAKAGLWAQTKILVQELGPRIRVNAVAPGAILPAPGTSEEIFQILGQKNPLRTTGSPESIAQAMIYLLSASFVTGEVLHVTGGEELNRG